MFSGSRQAAVLVLSLFWHVPADARTVVSLTFDDNTDSHNTARQILDQRGVKGTFYVNRGRIGASGYLTLDALRSIAASGHEIAGHTLNHLDLTAQTATEARRQVCDDRSALVSWGFDPVSFAYPFGAYDSGVQQIVRDCGYSNARTVGGIGCSGCPRVEPLPPPDAFAIQTPVSVKSDTTLAALQKYVTDAEAAGGGWIALVMHLVCDGCSTLAISPATLAAFVDWLKPRAASGTEIKTVREAMGAPPGPTRPAPLVENFSYPDGLITNEYATRRPNRRDAVISPVWSVSEGSLFASGGMGWTGAPDDETPNGGSTRGTGSAVFRLASKRTDFRDAALAVDLLFQGYGASRRPAPTPADGVALALRYRGEETAYLFGVKRRDGTAAIVKRVAGVQTTLASTPFSLPEGQRRRVEARARDRADGAVELSLSVDGEPILSAIDAASPIPGPAAIGVWGTRSEFRLDDLLAGPPAAESPPPPAPAPTLSRLDPSSAAAGGPAFTLTAIGSSISSTTVLRWNGAERPSTVLSGSTVTARIESVDIASTGTASIDLFTPGAGASNALSLAIFAPQPAPAPAPEPGLLFSDAFSLPDGLITNEYATYNPNDPNAVRSGTWSVTSGSLFARGGMGWTGFPDSATPNASSSNGTNSAVFRLVTQRSDFGNVVLRFKLINLGLTATVATPAAGTDGVSAALRYQSSQTFYLLMLNRRDNTLSLKRRLNGTYTTLGGGSFAVPYGQIQDVEASALEQPDGSIRLQLSINGIVRAAATDASAPIRSAGRLGVWGTNDEFKLDDVAVRRADSRSSIAGGAPPPPIPSQPPAPACKVYPNPWRADRHKGFPLRFDGLSGATSVKLFTTSGRWIRTLDAQSGRAQWDLVDGEGRPVAGGFFFYSTVGGDGKPSTGVIAIIR